MKDALQSRIGKGPFLVQEKWAATSKTIKDLGHTSAPNHSSGFHIVGSGWHCNDIESRFALLMRWLRRRYGCLPPAVSDQFGGGLYECTFMTNYAAMWDTVLEALVA
jgi:hypothetical protein